MARLALILGFFALPALVAVVDRTGNGADRARGAETASTAGPSFTGSRLSDFALWGVGVGIVGWTIVAENNRRSPRTADHRSPVS